MVRISPFSATFQSLPAAAVLCVVVVVMIAGCMGGDVIIDQDLAVIKLTSDGSMAWMKTIDSGKDDEVTDVIQTSDGGYALAGGYSTPGCNRISHFPTTPMIYRLSEKGDIVWEREYTSEIVGKTKYRNSIKGLVQSPDDGFYVITENGMILKTSSGGVVLWSHSRDPNPGNYSTITSIIRTYDGTSVFAGVSLHCEFDDNIEHCPSEHKVFIEKMDQNMKATWTRIYSDLGLGSVSRIIALDNDEGYTGIMENAGNFSYVILDDEGSFLSSSPVIDLIYGPENIQAIPGGFTGFAINRSMNTTLEARAYTDNGRITKITLLENFTQGHPTSFRKATIVTRDMSYFGIRTNGSYYSRPITTSVNALKFDNNGNQVWDRQVTSLTADRDNVEFRDLIETRDGGYLLVLGVEKWKSC